MGQFNAGLEAWCEFGRAARRDAARSLANLQNNQGGWGAGWGELSPSPITRRVRSLSRRFFRNHFTLGEVCGAFRLPSTSPICRITKLRDTHEVSRRLFLPDLGCLRVAPTF